MKKVRKRLIVIMVCVIAVLCGCAKKPVLNRYDAQFLSLFDTVTSIVGYAEDKETFTAFVQEFHDQLENYHQLYDIYHEYEGLPNLKTINENAGKQPVKVDRKIIDLLLFAKDMYEETDGKVNVAMGSVLSVWHDYRAEAVDNPQEAAIPPMEVLEEANQYTDINQLVIDEAESTVYLADSHMSLDVGAIAKGYAVEQVCQALEMEGFNQALVSVGGNVRAIGLKGDESLWKVGIQNPDLESEEKYLYTVGITDRSLVSSGSYQRYYTVDGKTYHHIVNPDTLVPWNEYLSVSILCRDSGMADALSTAVFNMKLEDGKKLVESFEDTEAMWILPDGEEVFSSGFQNYMKE